MADDEAKPATPAAPMVFTRGGTTSSSHDTLMAKLRADTEQRRAVQDQQYATAAADPLGARLHSMKLGGSQTSAVAVLAIKHPKDQLFLDWIIADILDQGDELALNMACPTCHARNPGHEPDFKLHQRNRKWWLDPRPPRWMRDMGSDRIWVNPRDQSTVVVAGSVFCDEWIKCPGLGCTWTFKIDDSVIHSR